MMINGIPVTGLLIFTKRIFWGRLLFKGSSEFCRKVFFGTASFQMSRMVNHAASVVRAGTCETMQDLCTSTMAGDSIVGHVAAAVKSVTRLSDHMHKHTGNKRERLKDPLPDTNKLQEQLNSTFFDLMRSKHVKAILYFIAPDIPQTIQEFRMT